MPCERVVRTVKEGQQRERERAKEKNKKRRN